MKQSLRIAIADDEQVLSTLLKRQLVDLGYSVVLETRSGVELLDGLADVTADLVITDINMTKLDGIDAAELISARYGLPIIFVSGADIDTFQHRLGDCPAYAYLTKPFQKQQLQATIVLAMQRFKETQLLSGQLQE